MLPSCDDRECVAAAQSGHFAREIDERPVAREVILGDTRGGYVASHSLHDLDRLAGQLDGVDSRRIERVAEREDQVPRRRIAGQLNFHTISGDVGDRLAIGRNRGRRARRRWPRSAARTGTFDQEVVEAVHPMQVQPSARGVNELSAVGRNGDRRPVLPGQQSPFGQGQNIAIHRAGLGRLERPGREAGEHGEHEAGGPGQHSFLQWDGGAGIGSARSNETPAGSLRTASMSTRTSAIEW
jgi:hypothetical protein